MPAAPIIARVTQVVRRWQGVRQLVVNKSTTMDGGGMGDGGGGGVGDVLPETPGLIVQCDAFFPWQSFLVF